MSIEALKSIFDGAAVVLLFLTFAAGAGVLITGNIINRRQEEKLRTFDSDLTSAKSSLAKQQERAANADARVVGLEQNASDAKAEMARQQERAATAERSLLELQGSLGRRTLSDKQQADLRARLSKFKGLQADLFVFEGDEWTRFEAMTFAKLLMFVLDNAGMDTRGYWGTNCGTLTPALGVSVINSPGATLEEQLAAKEMIESFPGAGIEMAYFPRSMPTCQRFTGLSVPDPRKPNRGHWANIKIMIGDKPPAMLQRPTWRDASQPVAPPKK